MGFSPSSGSNRSSKRRLTVAFTMAALSLLVASAGLSACLDATQIRVVLSGDSALCSARPKYVLRVVGSPAELERTSDEINAGVPFPSCVGENGIVDLGDLTVIPQGSSDRAKSVVVEVAIGLAGQDPTSCTAASAKGNTNCYVARRRVAFKPHTMLSLPIYFDQRCAGEVCNPASTCYRGSCVDSAATCVGSDCQTEAERTQGAGRDPTLPVTDSGPSDGATLEDGALVDAGPGDGASADALVDAKLDSGACGTEASAPAIANSKLICGDASTCCGSTSLATPLPCSGTEIERVCQTNCDCPSGSDCVDVVTSASDSYSRTLRAACLPRGCPNNGWGRLGVNGSSCDNSACCSAGTVCNMGTCQ
jgi:hypothetical protein